MSNLIHFNAGVMPEDNETLYLYFKIEENKYAVNVQHVVEIMKLPYLEYPQKLPNNIVGLLNYNNFTINILDIRFYLDIQVTPYTINNQLIIVKTDEMIFGFIVNNIEDIVSIDLSQTENFAFSGSEKLINFLYKMGEETISILNLSAFEDLLKHGCVSKDVDIPALFPSDDDSRYKLMQRNIALVEKTKLSLVANIFSQDQFISFSLNNSLFCINLEYVKEFLKGVAVTKIPCCPDYIAGVITLRGDFVTVVDIKRFLNLYNTVQNILDEDKFNVIVIETTEYKIGFMVDEIFNIIEISEDLISQSYYRQTNKYIQSEVILEDKVYTILNMKNILSDERFFIEEKF